MALDLTVRLRYTWTAAEARRGVDVHLNRGHGRVTRAAMGAASGFALVVAAVLAATGTPGAFGPWVVVLLVPVMVALWPGWRMRRQVARDPLEGLPVVVELTPERVAYIAEGWSARWSWDVVHEVVWAPDGFLIYPAPNQFVWIPAAAFASGEEAARVRRVVRAGARRFSTVA